MQALEHVDTSQLERSSVRPGRPGVAGFGCWAPLSLTTGCPPTLLTAFTVLGLHLLFVLIAVMIVVGVVLHVPEAEVGHIGYVRVHLLGAPEGQGGEASLEPSMEEQGWGPKRGAEADCFEAGILSPHPYRLPTELPAWLLVPQPPLLPQEGLEGLQAGLSQLIVIQVAELLHQGHQASQVGPCRAKGSMK